MWYNKDVRYLAGDTIFEAKRLNELRKDNVQFLQYMYPTSSKDVSNFRILSVQALCNNSLGKEPIVQIGNNHESYRWRRT